MMKTEPLTLTQEWDMTQGSKYAGNKELLIIPGAVHTDLYDRKDVIPFDRIQAFMEEHLK